jgi:hypothetical protein
MNVWSKKWWMGVDGMGRVEMVIVALTTNIITDAGTAEEEDRVVAATVEVGVVRMAIPMEIIMEVEVVTVEVAIAMETTVKIDAKASFRRSLHHPNRTAIRKRRLRLVQMTMVLTAHRRPYNLPLYLVLSIPYLTALPAHLLALTTMSHLLSGFLQP